MAEEEYHVVELQDNFFRDSFGRVLFILGGMGLAIIFLIVLSLYLHFTKPSPVVFHVYHEWRVQEDVPLEQPYLSAPALTQWISNALSNAFNYDFSHYNEQLRQASHYFTANGWKIFLNQLNIYANYNNVQTYKLFVNGVPRAAP